MLNKQLLDKAQIATLFIALVGGAFKLLHWPGANMLLIIGLGSLGMCHIMLGLNTTNKNQKAVMLGYQKNFSITTLLFGILFYIMHWKGSQQMLLVGGSGVVFSFVLPFIIGGTEGEEK